MILFEKTTKFALIRIIKQKNSDRFKKNFILFGVKGFEPLMTIPKTVALPLSYTPKNLKFKRFFEKLTFDH